MNIIEEEVARDNEHILHETERWKVRYKATDNSFSHSADAPFYTYYCESEEGTKYMIEENALTSEVDVTPLANVGELVTSKKNGK